MAYIVNGNVITFENGYSVDFEHPIKETLDVGKVVIITVRPSSGIIYNHNVFTFSLTGDFLWRIGDVKLYYWGSNNCPYIGAELNDEQELILFNWCDTAVVVNHETGEVLRTWQTK